METAIYYRDQEFISKEQYQKMIKLFGGSDIHPYNWVEHRVIDQNYGTGLIYVTNIMETIQNDQKLNERCQELEQRIKDRPKLTASKSRYFKFVEESLLWDLVASADRIARPYLCDESRSQSKHGMIPFKEFKRLFKIPYEAKFEDFKTNYDLDKIKQIKEPKKLFNLKGIKGHNSADSCFKCYDINIKQHKELFKSIGFLSHSFNDSNRNFSTKHNMPYVGKVYWSTLSENSDNHYMQINVYDYVNSDRALQNVLNILNK